MCPVQDEQVPECVDDGLDVELHEEEEEEPQLTPIPNPRNKKRRKVVVEDGEHNQEQEIQEIPPAVRENALFKCPHADCNKVYKNNYQFRRHYKEKHLKIKTFCNECGRSFTRGANLNKHIEQNKCA